MVNSKTIDEILESLNALLKSNKDENGEYKLNLTRTAVALEFARKEIELSISEQQK